MSCCRSAASHFWSSGRSCGRCPRLSLRGAHGGNPQPVRRRAPILGGFTLLLAAALATLPLGRTANAAVPVLVIDGKGFGHGVGMAQDGAYWMARSGATTAD